jgi:hypothetical protein
VVDQPVGGHDGVGVQQQHGEQRPLLRTADHQSFLVVPDLQRT